MRIFTLAILIFSLGLLLAFRISTSNFRAHSKIDKTNSQISGKFFLKVREKITANFNMLLPARESTLVQGSVLGVDNIRRDFKDQLIKTGTIHVVVVSGQNLMIVAGLFLSQAKYIGKRQSLILATMAVFLYALLTGFEPPVVRASLMVLASSAAIFFGREALPIWNLFIAALVILFIWPTALFEVSFQLTFAATLGIMTLGQKLSKLFGGVLKGPVSDFPPASARSSQISVIDQLDNVELRAVESPFITATLKRVVFSLLVQNAAIATSAYLFTAPVIFYYFGRVSLLSPLTNILVIEAVSPIMILGFLTAIASLIFMPVAQLLAYLAYIPALYFVKIVQLFAKIPVGQMSLGKGSLIFVALYCLFLLCLILIWIPKKRQIRGAKN